MEDSQMAVVLSRQLAERIGAHRFDLWIGSQTRLCIEAARLTIHAASDFVRDWLRSNLADDIRACWQALVGHAATVEFAVDTSLAARPKTTATSPQSTAASATTAKSQPNSRPKPAARTAASETSAASGRPEETLASFVAGPSNEYALRAAEMVASGRQQASPVLFCAATGMGKSHLLKAIVREYRRRHRGSTAVYLTAEQFTTGFIEALRGSGLPSFRQKCRGAHVLLIDDLQFFAGKERTLEELQHTVDTLLSAGRQLVFTSDRGLAALRSLGAELCSRLAGGLTCEIEPPEFATRLEIVRRLSAEIGLAVSEDVAKTVAANIHAGARELRGALNRLQAASLDRKASVTRDAAERALADWARHNTRTVRLADVQKAVCEVFGVEPAQLRSDRKGRSVSEPRLLAMWLARKHTRAAWSEIAEFFGRRSHSTVISAHRRVEQLITSQAHVGVSDRECGVDEAIRRLETALRTA